MPEIVRHPLSGSDLFKCLDCFVSESEYKLVIDKYRCDKCNYDLCKKCRKNHVCPHRKNLKQAFTDLAAQREKIARDDIRKDDEINRLINDLTTQLLREKKLHEIHIDEIQSKYEKTINDLSIINRELTEESKRLIDRLQKIEFKREEEKSK